MNNKTDSEEIMKILKEAKRGGRAGNTHHGK